MKSELNAAKASQPAAAVISPGNQVPPGIVFYLL
jgi:hypothetical protein